MNKLENKYLDYLKTTKSTVYKIPFIKTYPDLSEEIPVFLDTFTQESLPENGMPIWAQLRAINLVKDRKNSNVLVQMYQRGQSISKVGRMRGNLEYLEDRWNVQIQPLAFKYAFINRGKLDYTNAKQSKIRDKYLKIRVRYDGKQYVVVNAIKTNYTISYA